MKTGKTNYNLFSKVENQGNHEQKLKSTAQKMKFFIKDFFNKCYQIRRKLRIWSHLLKKSLMENFIFCGVKLRTKENKQ